MKKIILKESKAKNSLIRGIRIVQYTRNHFNEMGTNGDLEEIIDVFITIEIKIFGIWFTIFYRYYNLLDADTKEYIDTEHRYALNVCEDIYKLLTDKY